MTVHLFHATDGELEVIVLPGEGAEARQAARALCWERVRDDSDVYRGTLFDALSLRNTFDTDNSWYEPKVEAAA